MKPLTISSKSEIPHALQISINGLIGTATKSWIAVAAVTWALIISSIMIASYMNVWWFSVIVVFFVATRMNILALLVHDQAHYCGFDTSNRFGDIISDLVCAIPLLLLTTGGYAGVHLMHHAKYFSDQDPDFLRKSGPNWQTPMSRAKLLGLFLRDLTGFSVIAMIKGKKNVASPIVRKHPSPKWLRPLALVLMATTLTLTHTWTLWLVYWLLPLCTVFMVIVRIGALCEHQYTGQQHDMLETTPMIEPSILNKLLMPNLNFSLHIYHHLFARIPFSRLPQAHALFKQHGLVDEQQVFHGVGAYLAYITRPAR